MSHVFERRSLIEPVEFRGEEDGKRILAAGIAIRYNTVSKDVGGYVERIHPSAAKKTIKERDVVALTNHDPNMLLGRTSSGTLRLTNDAEALRYEIELPDTTAGRDTAVLLERRDIIGSSFGFRNVVPPEWSKTEDGRALRTVVELSLRDVGPVTFPAYDSSEAALRSLADQTGVELRALVEAAEHGTLADYIDLQPRSETDEVKEKEEQDEQPQEEQEEDGRASTVFRRPLMSLYL